MTNIQERSINRLETICLYALAAILLPGLLGCDEKSSMKSYQERRSDYLLRSVVVDPVTGCQYLNVDRGITPRLDSAGKPMCGDK
jgi:hypothetical protein